MRILIAVLTLFLLVSCHKKESGSHDSGGGSTAMDLSGNWLAMATSASTGKSGYFSVILAQNGSSLTGSYSAGNNPCFPSGDLTGTVSGNQVRFSGNSVGGGFSFSGTAASSTSMNGYLALTGNGASGVCVGEESGSVAMSKSTQANAKQAKK